LIAVAAIPPPTACITRESTSHVQKINKYALSEIGLVDRPIMPMKRPRIT
jgi:hypothetical protein